MRRSLTFTVLSCLLIFSACNRTKNKTPSYLLSEDDMVEIMVDMHIIETALNLGVFQTDSVYQTRFASIFASHGTTKADFDSSLFYYVTNTDRMNTVYDRVLEDLYELDSELSVADSTQNQP